MSNAYAPVRIWPYPYFFRSTPSERQTVARVDTEGAEAAGKVEVKSRVPRDFNLGCDNPDWWVSHHYENR